MFKKLPLFIAFFFIFISFSAQKPKENVLKGSTSKLFLKNEPEPEVDLDSVNLDSVSLNLVTAIVTSVKNKETIRTQNENFKKIQTDINKEIIKTIASIEKSLKNQKLENYKYSDSVSVNSIIDTTSKQIVIGSKDYLNTLEVKLSKDTLLTNSEKRKIKRLIRKQHKLNQQLEDSQ